MGKMEYVEFKGKEADTIKNIITYEIEIAQQNAWRDIVKRLLALNPHRMSLSDLFELESGIELEHDVAISEDDKKRKKFAEKLLKRIKKWKKKKEREWKKAAANPIIPCINVYPYDINTYPVSFIAITAADYEQVAKKIKAYRLTGDPITVQKVGEKYKLFWGKRQRVLKARQAKLPRIMCVAVNPETLDVEEILSLDPNEIIL